jgi:hypothetical protein
MWALAGRGLPPTAIRVAAAPPPLRRALVLASALTTDHPIPTKGPQQVSEHESLDQKASDEMPAGGETSLTGFVATMAEVAEVLKVAADTATGYREHLITAGWHEQTAHFLAGSALQTWQQRFLGGQL